MCMCVYMVMECTYCYSDVRWQWDRKNPYAQPTGSVRFACGQRIVVCRDTDVQVRWPWDRKNPYAQPTGFVRFACGQRIVVCRLPFQLGSPGNKYIN